MKASAVARRTSNGTAGAKAPAARRAPAKPAPEGRRERNKREKLQRIVAAARALFRAQGFDKTTTQEIAEAAGIGSGTLFLYAKSKEDLLVLVFRDEMSELIERAFEEIPDTLPLLEQTTMLFDRFIAYHRRDFAIAQSLLRELSFLSNPARRDPVNAIPNLIANNLAPRVAAAQARGEIRRDLDPSTAGHCLFSVYYQQLLIWAGSYASYAQFKRNLGKLLEFVVEGMRAR
ncbi:MAG: TetR family transcriptional regulator [Alphaproteobacteria bacterium]|nr:TetR family transcriptional regulator [Alphaproteobacteria bacterium]